MRSNEHKLQEENRLVRNFELSRRMRLEWVGSMAWLRHKSRGGLLRLQVHAAEQADEARVGAQRTEEFILAGSDHNPNGLNGSSHEALAICVDPHPETR